MFQPAKKIARAFCRMGSMIPLLVMLVFAPALAASMPPAPPAPAKSAPPQGEIAYSYYLISCGTFIEHRLPGAENSYNTTADTFYVAGWLSAYNRLRPDEGVPDDTTLDDILLWLEHYCQKNPLSNLEDGLFQLGDEVRPRHEEQEQPPLKPSPLPGPPAHAPVVIAPKQPSVPGLKPLPY